MIENDPELQQQGKYLGTITSDFAKIADILQESSYQIRSRKISEFPVFPISKVQISIGQVLIEKEKLGLTWNYYISYLDEFIQRGLVEKEEVFQQAYKNPEEYCCLFVVDEEFTNFVFLPYPETES